ncbi:MAG: dihydroorotate dehydrogenase electron transfer subunit [Oscillospiraceae bacterium]|nr:dihydroorotate dehydrogenase electron transfer subunit [Oscillospiraceae bacterium]
MPDRYLCEVISNETLCDGVFAVAVVCGDLAGEALAGQFVHVKCGDERLLRRPISICCVSGGSLKLVFEVKGKGTSWLSRIKPGETIDILGPLGRGFSLPEGKVALVGGGIGVPPLLFAAELAGGSATSVLGFRSGDRAIMKDAFESACEKVLIATDDGSLGYHGPVTLPLKELLEGEGYGAILACGPRPMLNAVAGLCEQFGVPCQVSLEEKMGCGIGACLVCACATVSGGVKDMSRVCVDGPVFDATEIVWSGWDA